MGGYTRKPFSLDEAGDFLDHYLGTKPARLLGLTSIGVKERLLENASGYADVFERVLALVSEGSGKDTIGEKTPHHLNCIDYILELYPEAPVVAMIRDGRAVTSSRMRHPDWEKNLLAATWRWRDDARRLLRLVNGERRGNVLVVRYEDLVTHTAEEMKRIVKHLGVAFEGEMLHTSQSPQDRFQDYYKQEWMSKSTESVDVSRISAWKELWTNKEICLVEREIKRELRLFGYECCSDRDCSVSLFRGWEALRHYLYRARKRVHRVLG